MLIPKRFFSNSVVSLRHYYDPSRIPPPPKLSALEFIRKRPDPVPMPKSISQTLADGSTTFHSMAIRKPLYAFLPENASSVMPKEALNEILPPEVFDRRLGRYGPRDLTDEEKVLMKKDREEQGMKVRAIAEKYKCALYQAVELLSRVERRRRHGRYKWWFKKQYERAI